MRATYHVNVTNEHTVEMTGDVEHLDTIALQMQSHRPLLEACRAALRVLYKMNCHRTEKGIPIVRQVEEAIEKADGQIQ